VGHGHLPMVDGVNLLNDSQLKSAAILYCKAFGLDPDERTQYAHPDGYAVALFRPRWMAVAELIKEHDAMAEAAQEVRSGQT